jgi:hypothetical protein
LAASTGRKYSVTVDGDTAKDSTTPSVSARLAVRLLLSDARGARISR